MTVAKFRIVLQLENTKDDVLTIQPSSSPLLYDVTFKQETIGVINKALLRPSGIVPYIELFLDSVLLDQNGFNIIQIDCPQYPSVILRRDNIAHYMTILRIQLNSIVENWPYEEVMK